MPRIGGLAVTGALVGGLVTATAGSGDLLGRHAAGNTAPNLDGRVLDAVFTAHPQGLDAGTDAWVVDGCSRVADHIANKWTHDLFLTWEGSRVDANNRYRSGRPGDVSMLLTRAAEDDVRRMEVYVHRMCAPAAVARLSGSPKVLLIRVP